MYPNNPLFPAEQEATLGAAAHWVDTFFFTVSVAMAFQPKAVGSSPLFSDPEAAAAFMADRAEFSKGSSQLGMAFEQAEPHWHLHMRRLDEQLSHQAYLGGADPSIIDFSNYHCLWFAYGNEALREDFAPFTHVLNWLERIQGFGHGGLNEMSGADALQIARSSDPVAIEKQGLQL